MVLVNTTMVIEMFCPNMIVNEDGEEEGICGTLCFPDSDGNIKCPNYKCGYEGPVEGKDGEGAKIIDRVTGDIIDLSDRSNTIGGSRTKSLKHLTEVVPIDKPKGTLREGDYICPKCNGRDAYVHLQQTRSSDEPETKFCTCANLECKHKWREYQ